MKRFLALVNGNADSKSLFLCCVSADSFPHALELSKNGYNAFALIYRPGGCMASVWGLDPAGKTEAELAEAFVDVLADFIREIGLPTTFAEMNIPDDTDYKAIADSTVLTGGCAKKFTREELLEVLLECR